MTANVEGAWWTATDNLHDMAPFSLTVALPKPSCISNGQLTPPPSPNDVVPRPVQYQIKRKLQNSQAVTQIAHCRRVTRSSDKTRCSDLQQHPTTGYAGHSIDSVADDITFQRPSMLSNSEFLHHSTTSENISTKPLSELRRKSQTYRNLRSIAQEHEQEHSANPHSSTAPFSTPTLLPSLFVDEPKMDLDDNARPLYQVNDRRDTRHWSTEAAHQSCDVMQILSCYEDHPNTSSELIDKYGWRRSSTMPDVSALPPIGTTLPSWVVKDECPEHLRPRSTDSVELGHLIKSAANPERLRKFKARCYQIVQHPFRANGPKYEEEGTIMLATVLVGPGKPKLVQIQRPPSSNNSSRGSRTLSIQSTQSLEPVQSTISTPPCTPVRQCKELSAFSPYDTPSVATPFANVAPIQANSPTIEQTPLTASKLDLVPNPLSLLHRVSSDSDESVFSNTERRVRALTRNLSQHPYGNDNYTLAGTTVTTWPEDDLDPASSSPVQTRTSPRTAKRRRLERKLDAITAAIDNFPVNMLDLESPPAIDIRLLPCERKNNMHIDNLSKVFVGAPKQILSSLAAWVIVDSYVSSLHLDHTAAKPAYRNFSVPLATKQPVIPPRSFSLSSSNHSTKYDIDTICEHFPTPPSNYSKIIVNTSSGFPSSSPPSNDQVSIDIIPVKARSILGLDQQVPWLHSDEQLLVTRARALSLSIGVVAQKLVEVLRGEGGWDPYLWRALGVVVGAVEESDI